MKMRELEVRTGVNRETIRVFLREGLLPQPSRPDRNVADYSEDHVRTIMAVRELQRESGLTLPQIKAMMNGERPDRRVEAGAFQHLEELLAARVGYEERFVPVSAIAHDNPHAESDARAMQAIGVVSIRESDGNLQMSMTDAALVEAWARMRQGGFNEENGFPPEILGYYVKAAEYVAANEANLFLEATTGRIDEAQAAKMLQMALPTMLDFFGLLRLKAFMRNLHDRTKEHQNIPIVLPE